MKDHITLILICILLGLSLIFNGVMLHALIAGRDFDKGWNACMTQWVYHNNGIKLDKKK